MCYADVAQGGKADLKGGGKGGAAPAAPPPTVWPPIWLPRGAQLNAARTLRSCIQALLDFLEALRDGESLHTGKCWPFDSISSTI